MLAPRIRQINLTLLVPVLLALCISGCIGVRPGEMHVKDIQNQALGFIKPGITTRDEIIRRLGPPTVSLSNQGIYGYRMSLYKNFHPTPESEGWFNDYELSAATPETQVKMGMLGSDPCKGYNFLGCHEVILVFDDRSVVRRYRLFKPYARNQKS